MLVNKLTVGSFIPKRLGMKKIIVNGPSNTLVENSLTIASRIQKQDELVKAANSIKETPKKFAQLDWNKIKSCDNNKILETPIFTQDRMESAPFKIRDFYN